MVNIGNDWDERLADVFASTEYKTLRKFLVTQYNNYTVFPPADQIFNAFRYTPYSKVKAVIIGQDPYHEKGQAHGLCFSVLPGIEPPPSLKNIFKEISDDLGYTFDMSYGCLTDWAKQGVLMLNSALTVREGMAGSHRNSGWHEITDMIISVLNKKTEPVAFILWGANAKSKAALITSPQHGIFTAAHPSPLSAHNGFFGCRHFSKVNAFLEQNGIPPIDWHIYPERQ